MASLGGGSSGRVHHQVGEDGLEAGGKRGAEGVGHDGVWPPSLAPPCASEEGLGAPRMEGEPVVATTKKELWGWYLYEAASSGFSGSVLPVFLPLLILSLSTDRAWQELGARAPPVCDAVRKVDCLKCVPGKGDQLLTASGYHDIPRLRVYIGELGIDPVAFTTVSIGVSIIFQLLIFITYGPLSDYGTWRRSIWITGSALGVLGCLACLGMASASLWWVAGALLVATNVSYGIAYICYNSYLPLLTDASPDVLTAAGRPFKEQVQARRAAENAISLGGTNVGSLLGAACVVLSFGVSLVPGLSDQLILRLACAVGGLWWAALSVPSFLWVLSRPGPPLPPSAGWFFGWRATARLLRRARTHAHAFRYLLLYFVFSDGYATLNQTGALFAQQQLCMPTPQVAALVVLVGAFAVAGNPVAAWAQRRTGWDNLAMLQACLLAMAVLPAYAVLGYLPAASARGWGLRTRAEMFVFAAWYGATLGPLTSYARTLYVDLIPPGAESAMFTLLALSSKGSSWLGPLLVGFLSQAFGDLRTVFVYLLLVIVVPVALLHLLVDNTQGMIDAGRVPVDAAAPEQDPEEEMVAVRVSAVEPDDDQWSRGLPTTRTASTTAGAAAAAAEQHLLAATTANSP